MSASLDFGIEYRPISAPRRLTLSGLSGWELIKVIRRRRVDQFFRDFPNCYYCGVLLDKSNRSLDHFVPRSLGGTTMFVNLVTACKDCNKQKGNSLPSGMETVPEELTVQGRLVCFDRRNSW